MIYFSKSTNGFFFDGINSDMPADIVEISTDLYNELIAGQQEGGKLITSDENGLPVLKSPAIDYVARAENQRMQLLAHADNVTAAYFHERRSLNNFHRDRVITFEQIAE
ncbi:tail fiber assembly protein, partial [Escherichia coli]|uniref:tail fiber assembly protein n=1 Tax=Escherichia coli TaxID=562 RepID=UPI002157192D